MSRQAVDRGFSFAIVLRGCASLKQTEKGNGGVTADWCLLGNVTVMTVCVFVSVYCCIGIKTFISNSITFN